MPPGVTMTLEHRFMYLGNFETPMTAVEINRSIDCATFLKVLADQTRLAVIRLLIRRSLTVGELNQSLDIEQTLLSHHLRVLRDAGVVEHQREGRSIRYSIAAAVKSAGRGAAVDLGCCQILFDEKGKS